MKAAWSALALAWPLFALDPLQSYTFTPDASEEVAFEATESPVVLGGRSTTECSNNGFTENVSDIAIAITDKGQGCYASDQYSVGDFPVVLGRVTIQSSSINVAAVEIRAAESPAVQFVASGSRLYWRLPGDGAEYSIYRLRNGVLIRLATMQALDTAQFVSTSVNLEAITSPEIYVLLPSSQIIPSPSKMVLSGQQVTECDHVFPESETIGDITLVTMSGSNSNCWTDDRYSNSNYLVEKGLLGTMVAFRISPPTTIATQFVASRTNLYIRNPANDVKVWTYGHGQFELLDTVSKSDMDFAKTTVRLDNLEEELIVLIRPGTEQLTVWPQVSSTVEAAVLDGGDQWSLNCHRFQLDGQPFVPKLHWNHGPGTHSGNYGTYKRFFAVLRTDGREGVVWQDFTNDVVKVTWLAADLLSSETHQLTALNSQVLVGAAGDGANEMVLILGASEKPASKSGTVEAEAVKFSVTGSELLRKALPTEKATMNVYSFSQSGATVAWDRGAGTIACAIARTMTIAGDGLNHQGGIAIVLNASTLELISNYGQTSGHSFANSLQVSSKEGWYLGMDLGDNYPRGVNLWELKGDSRSWRKKLVYTFKTKHGTSPTSPAGAAYPEYTAISTAQQTYYQWSNDNYLYTELAHPGLHEVDDTVLVFFAGEKPPLDNSLVGKAMNVARNVAWVKISRDLQNSSVLSPGEEEIGGFYTFGGSFSEQTNRGISFLTSYTDLSQSVSRLKTAAINGQIVLLWEIWSSSSYNRTEFMVIDTKGQIQGSWPLTSLSFPFELPFADDVVVKNGRVVTYVGTDGSKGSSPSLARFELCLGSTCEQITGTTGTTDSGGGSDGGQSTSAAGNSGVSSTAPNDVSASGSMSLMLSAATLLAFRAFGI